ncbi:MAG: DUF1552 domain-containing protein, partial [Myxococcaceae bacterium]|nr:DUF1552 domain-containing protein [Myxococcaceae bacterium]
MSPLSRRALLSHLARLSAASAFAPLLDVAAAPAERGFTPPRNLLVLFHPNGFEQGWKPAMTDGALSLGPTLAPLEAFKARLLVTYGLKAGIRHEVQAHTEGMTSMLTGALIQKADAYAAHPSFDQLVAEKIAGA